MTSDPWKRRVRTNVNPTGRVEAKSSDMAAGPPEQTLRSCEAKLITYIRKDWALAFGSREVQLVIEYQEGVPVLIRVTDNKVTEEKLK